MFAILFSKDMQPFYDNIFSFPTVVFTGLLVICVVFWLVSVFGAGLDAFDIGDGDLSETGPNALVGLLWRFGLRDIPFTIILTLTTLFGWLISYYVVQLTFGLLPFDWLRYVAGIAVVIAAAAVGLKLTALVMRPFAVFFRKSGEVSVKQVLGQTAVVRTSVVNASFGEANLDDGGAGLILKVRASGDATHEKGDRVVLLEYNEAGHYYRVISEEEFKGI